MTDTPGLNLYDFGLAQLLPANVDENLLLDATQRWRDCCNGMRELMAGTPTVRTVVNQMLQEHLQLDGEHAGLRFPATQTRGSSILSINEACIYMQQHPALDTTQVPQGELIYLPNNHRLAGYTVPMLLDELKGLDLEQAIKDAWHRHFLNNRAPNQPVSCRTRAAEFYKIHFEASGQAMLSQGSINATALNPMFAIIDPLLAEPGTKNICTEQIMLKRTAGEALVLPGSWVLTLDTDQPVSQLVYLPTHQPAWHTFAKRTDMERWVIDQQQVLFSTADSDPLATVEYRLKTHLLETGIGDWLTLLADAQYREAIKPVPGIEIENAHLARHPIEAFDKQRQSQSLFAQAPEPPTPRPLEDDTLTQFGLLYSSLPLSQRQARVLQQRTALDALPGEGAPTANRNTHLLQLKQKLDDLRVQQQAAAVAARLMLERRTADFATLNTQFTALYNARVAGLRIEAQIQQALNQISADELKLLEVILDSPVFEDRLVEVAAYSMSLSVTEKTNSTIKITESELKGPLVFTAAAASESQPPSAASYLVYWPGTGGALQRFASRQALQEALFNIAPQDDQLALVLKELTGNPFEYSLRLQQADFEEHAAQLRSTHSTPEEADTLAKSLKKLREATLEKLLVPEHSAREAAFLEIVEQNNSSHLAEKLPTWLVTQTKEQQEELNARLRDYIPALKRFHALVVQSLPSRDAFVRLKIDSRLRKDFAVTKGFTVQLDLPDSTRDIRDPVTGGSAVGGTAVKITTTPSLARSKISLDELALRNIDTVMGKRLHYMTLDVTADDSAELSRLKTGINPEYVTKMVRDLNLAAAYETLIYQAFRGRPQESAFQLDYRRECLTEPLRLMLQVQGLVAFMQNHINTEELQVWDAAIKADTRKAWEVGTKRIALLPATLVDDSDNNRYGTVTLSGISFIQEKTSGVTLLYLPDAPDDRCLRRFDSLELARRKLFDLCRLDTMVKYVASRALTGEVQSHINRIDRATAKNYNAIIGIGFPWPATTSLAAHQLDAHMGRLIESNRNDARSNEDLADEKYALKSGQLVNGIKIALGFIPLIGTAVSLVDAGTSLYAAVDAFRKGDMHHGIDQLASVFDSLVYAGMDTLTFAALPSSRPATAKALMQQHQRQHAWRPEFWRNLKSRGVKKTTAHRFAGYEFDQPLESGSLQPVHTGPYRHTLRHTSGEHFIADAGNYFKVKFDRTTHEMRLLAKGKYYSPVIALDETLEWNTYSALHGGHLTAYGGGSGRGQGTSRAGTSRPAAVEQQTPPMVASALTQRQAIINNIGKRAKNLTEQALANNLKAQELEVQFKNSTTTGTTSKHRATKDLDSLLINDVESGKQLYALYDTAAGLQGGTLNQVLARTKDWTAMVVGTRYAQMGVNIQRRLIGLRDDFIALTDLMKAKRPIDAEYLNAEKALRECRINMLNELKQMDIALTNMETWRKRITLSDHKPIFNEAASSLQENFTLQRVQATQAELLLTLLHGERDPLNISWIYQERLLKPALSKLHRAITAHRDLPEANISRAQRNQVLSNTLEVYKQLHLDLTSWNAVSPSHFDASYVSQLLDTLTQLMERARKGIKGAHTKGQPKHTKSLFETEDGQILVGTEKPAQQQSPRRFIVNDSEGKPVEVWDQISDSSKYRLNTELSQPKTAPPALPSDLATTLTEAESRLAAVDAFENTVRSYKTMEPVNLEHMLVSEAQALEFRANQLQGLSPNHSLIEQLRTRAAPLRPAGQALRIERTLASKAPTEGYLDYLKEMNRVEIRKVGIRRKLTQKRPDGETDYLQEYAIHDATKPKDKPIWFAHFHYVKADSAFDTFAKAHLKIPEQQYQGLHWQMKMDGRGLKFADLKIWRGNIDKLLAKKHFEALN
ncbi:hypothetical protein FFI16_020885 [Pseudomonas sp. KBS0710]|uniref:dermonecrotic toxin domain-containing protein n=1 Tax=Pseudomonas sp. KBS0710 TaxID=1179667 RepID=UPI00110EECB4|nr:DUF6543 domain-containing protein [Pseudomonas sp. KBS0710]TSD78776.1 hypothetical protein FFI16_020885 [Pseudomonas sp. KBS0710]